MFALQAQLNNNLNAIIEITFNKTIYNFKIKEALLLIYDENSTRNDIVDKRLKYRAKILKIIAFANVKAKIYYNVKHISLMFKLNNCTYLRLNYNYYLFNKFSKKTSF